MATAFIIIMCFVIPTLMLSKTEVWYGFVLNFLTVLLFAGLNEIARELEYPVRYSCTEYAYIRLYLLIIISNSLSSYRILN